jgi:hypothetical protein
MVRERRRRQTIEATGIIEPGNRRILRHCGMPDRRGDPRSPASSGQPDTLLSWCGRRRNARGLSKTPKRRVVCLRVRPSGSLFGCERGYAGVDHADGCHARGDRLYRERRRIKK